MSTERLYYDSPYLGDFDAQVVEILRYESAHGVVLDRTAFHPTGGGQPHDTGELGARIVHDVVEGDRGRIIHLLDAPPGFDPGDRVAGRVDMERRLDHLQQHSGQHLLSAAFVQVAGAATVSFHMGADRCTLDLDGEVSAQTAVDTEALANRVITEDRKMTARIVDEEDALRLPLRKELPVQGRVRVVTIENFDMTPCGGTHARSTAMIRMIALLGLEPHKGGTRVEFVAGDRVRRTLHALHDEAQELGELLSAPGGARVGALHSLLEARSDDLRRLRSLSARSACLEAEVLDVSTPGASVIRVLEEERNPKELEALARALSDRGRTALVAGATGGSGRVFVATDGAPHAGDTLRAAAGRFGARGGGGPRFAQAGGLEPGSLGELLDALESALS